MTAHIADMVDDLVDAWHERTEEMRTLQEFLGLTDDEYAAWLRYGKFPERLDEAVRAQHAAIFSR